MEPVRVIDILKHPSAWVPIVIPLCFFLYIAVTISFFGIVRSADEGAPAHLFQLWLVSEPLLLGYFAYRWLPRAPRAAATILALQTAAAVAAVFPIFYLGL